MTTYLTADELADLIGCKSNQRTSMKKWLDTNRWPYVIDRNGLPKVSRAYHDAVLSGQPTRELRKYADEPNFQAFDTAPVRTVRGR